MCSLAFFFLTCKRLGTGRAGLGSLEFVPPFSRGANAGSFFREGEPAFTSFRYFHLLGRLTSLRAQP